MADQITIGLDFGTHQTKICVQTIPDEGHGQPKYEFFKFKDLNRNESYFLPSVIQVNSDNTLSYGYVDRENEKFGEGSITAPIKQHIENSIGIDIDNEAKKIFYKYATSEDEDESIKVLKDMLIILNAKNQLQAINLRQTEETRYAETLVEYKKTRNYYEYFKQASFTDSEWNANLPCDTLSIWYLTYVLFILEEKYGNEFSVNMGIPADSITYGSKKQKALDMLATAFDLVENVFQNDKEKFLSTTLDELLEKTKPLHFVNKKEYFFIQVFPEAYASLVTLTSKGKLAEKLSLTVDIGGGTTDISFFMVSKGKPLIYRYWSLPHGLNFIAEKSGLNYRRCDFNKQVSKTAISMFAEELRQVHNELRLDLIRDFRKKSNDISKLSRGLKNNAVVYNGGGSFYRFLTRSIGDFTDVKHIEPAMWKEENIKDKSEVTPLCKLLTIAYGLSLSKNEANVTLCDFSDLFSNWEDKNSWDDRYIDKDMV